MLGLSLRHVYRLRARFPVEETAALAHDNRGRPSHRRLPIEVREEFSDFNDYRMTDILTEEYSIQVSRSSVRRTRRREGLSSLRKRRAPQHRSRRER